MDNQHCYVERKTSNIGTIFSFGCIENQNCPEHHDFTIVGRSTHDQCFQCCLGDGCNIQHCNIEHPPAITPPISCADDPASNCSHLSSVANICSDIHRAKTLCRKHCGLCGLVDGAWNTWVEWSPCSASCGIGSRSRSRNCTHPAPQKGGDTCKGRASQVQSCFPRACPTHGGWSYWAAWEACSVSCGEGVAQRHRTCTNPAPSLYGHFCLGDSMQYDICHENACSNITKHTNSSQTGSCHDILTECDLANKTTGICNLQQYARKMCPKFCSLCSILDGRWASWSSWGDCSVSCNNGTWSRKRTCTNPAPANGGDQCTGSSTETSVCHLRSCPIHGGWSHWASWVTCSTSCGPGITKRMRTCTNPRPSFEGNYCFSDSVEYGMCLIKPCPVDGKWSSWSLWNSCSSSCDTGQVTRQRFCENPSPSNGGHSCSGPSVEHMSCQAGTCPIDGGWSHWSSWSSCTNSCNGGEKRRHRSCSNPSPTRGGIPCVGNTDDLSVCNAHPCPNQLYKSAFTAKWPLQVTGTTTIRFATIITNIGTEYSASTGKYTCKYPGIYVFTLNLVRSFFAPGTVSCSVRKNHQQKVVVYIHDSGDDGYYSRSTSTVVHLIRGDMIDVDCPSGSLYIDSNSVLSGFLLKAD